MLFHRALVSLLLLSGSATAFTIAPAFKTGSRTPPLSAARKNNDIVNVLAAGVISAATILSPAGPAQAAGLSEGVILGGQLANFGKASYPVFNAAKDITPLVDAFLGLVDAEPNAADVATKAVDGLLAIPTASIDKYAKVLKDDVYKGVSKDSCVALGGSGSALSKFASSKAVTSAPKFAQVQKKFQNANSAVPVNKAGDICLPPSAEASEKLWTAQAELTLNIPKKEGADIVASLTKGGSSYATRTALAKLVPAAEQVFSKSPEALQMEAAGKQVEPTIIAAVKGAIK